MWVTSLSSHVCMIYNILSPDKYWPLLQSTKHFSFAMITHAGIETIYQIQLSDSCSIELRGMKCSPWWLRSEARFSTPPWESSCTFSDSTFSRALSAQVGNSYLIYVERAIHAWLPSMYKRSVHVTNCLCVLYTELARWLLGEGRITQIKSYLNYELCEYRHFVLCTKLSLSTPWRYSHNASLTLSLIASHSGYISVTWTLA